MYDPARAISSSHRTSPVRTYIMNVLGVQKVGFWADMPNRFINPYGNAVPAAPEATSVKYAPQIAQYVSKQWNAFPSQDGGQGPPIKPAQYSSQGAPSMPEAPIIGAKPLEGPPKTMWTDPTKVVTVVPNLDNYIDPATKAELAVLKGKKMPKKLKMPQGSSARVVAPAVTNRNYYKPTIYQSALSGGVRSMNIKGY